MKDFKRLRIYRIVDKKPVLASTFEEVMDAMRWFSANDNHVAQDIVGNVRISTVFLPTPQPPIPIKETDPVYVFETMTFSETKNRLSDRMKISERYATWEDAEAGHAAAVARIKSWLRIN